MTDDSSDNFVIFSYTRAQALADGEQVDVSEVAAEAGIRFPVFLTRAVYDAYVIVPKGVTLQDESGRLWDILWMTRFAIQRNRNAGDRVPVTLLVRNNNRGPRRVNLVAVCGPMDMDDPRPAITIMRPDED